MLQDLCSLSTILGTLFYTYSHFRFPFSNIADQTGMQYSAWGTVTVLCNGNSIFSLSENLHQSHSWLLWQLTETLKSLLAIPLPANKTPAWNRNFYYAPCTRFFIFCHSFYLQESSPKGITFFLTLFHYYISNASQSYVTTFILLLLCSLHCLAAMTHKFLCQLVQQSCAFLSAPSSGVSLFSLWRIRSCPHRLSKCN